MDTMIIKISIWKNVDKTETRYYVDAFRNEYEKQRGELVAVIHHGCLYKTGNSWHAKGSKDGDLTAEEWQAARDLGTSTSWVAYFHPRYNDIVRGGTDYRPFDEAKAEAAALAERQAERAKRDSRLDTALDVAGYSPVGSFVTVTNKDNTETVMIVLDTYEFAEEYEQPSSDRRQSGWYMRCGEPTEVERASPQYIALFQQIVEKQTRDARYKDDQNALAVQQFSVREKHTAEYWQQQRAERSKLPQEQQDLPDDELFNDLFKGDAE